MTWYNGQQHEGCSQAYRPIKGKRMHVLRWRWDCCWLVVDEIGLEGAGSVGQEGAEDVPDVVSRACGC